MDNFSKKFLENLLRIASPSGFEQEAVELWVKPQPAGQRAEDLVAWVVEYYPDLVKQSLQRKERP